MDSVIIITIEKKSDGSGNRKGYFRPDIHAFTSTKAAKRALVNFLNSVREDYDIINDTYFMKDFREDSYQLYHEHISDLADKTLKDEILVLDDYMKIRVTYLHVNPNILFSSTSDW